MNIRTKGLQNFAFRKRLISQEMFLAEQARHETEKRAEKKKSGSDGSRLGVFPNKYGTREITKVKENFP